MATILGIPLALALLFFSLCIETVISLKVVHVISNMPKDSPPLRINCMANGANVVQHFLTVGEDYEWSATINDV
ncbi:hypothetical protein Acr_01g0012410 [Actinidia rufa]|uniref:Uncharacterized protein n=1 Tax=Actinidia rufa TaxID=165716 RepID=A0A7J0E580_9ERIC|nr:hypothetical protein Acr_01g0012410 [Actinidia rufa]